MSDLVKQLVGALEASRAYIARYGYTGEQLAIIDAALTAAKAGGWLPIETAPKDGTEVLLLFSKAEYILGKLHGRVRAACWTGFGASANWSIPYFKDDAPTAWQPLPNPPKEQSAGGLGSLDDGA